MCVCWVEGSIAKDYLWSSSFFFSFLFMVESMTYGSSQAGGQLPAYHSHSNSGSQPHLWPVLHCSNARSLTHGVTPGIEPSSSWILARYLTRWATTDKYLIYCWTKFNWVHDWIIFKTSGQKKSGEIGLFQKLFTAESRERLHNLNIATDLHLW